jgi:flagellar biosynthesis/type III secretory pathway protein FliH
MKPPRVTVLKQGEYLAEELRALPRQARQKRVQIVPRARVEAGLKAQQLLSEAKAEAEQIIAAAKRQAADLTLIAEAEGRAKGAAAVASLAVRLKAREQGLAEQSLNQIVELARLLAERVLGEELRLDPSRTVALARQALTEARGASRVQIVCHPEDCASLEGALGALAVDSVVELLTDASRARGDLKVVTDVGTLDAAIAPQLQRLAIQLRQELAP